MKNTEFARLLEAFREWLTTLNCASSTVTVSYRNVKELLHYLEGRLIKTITAVDKEELDKFIETMRSRVNKLNGGYISEATIKSYYGSLRRFSKYLHQTGQGHLELEIPKRIKRCLLPKEIFTRDQISELYKACEDDLLGIRDRAMLSIYYGCGLRKSEGAALELIDVQFSRAMLFVRKGKNYKQRHVPMVGRVMSDLRNYLEYTRAFYAIESTANSLFVGYRGEQISGHTLAARLHRLKCLAGIKNKTSLHSLRHSIATHLLQDGMSLEQIARFLGHSSLESTQIYTRILHENTT